MPINLEFLELYCFWNAIIFLNNFNEVKSHTKKLPPFNYTIQQLLVYSQNCYHCITSEHFHYHKGTSHSLETTPLSSLLPVSIDLPIFVILCKCIHKLVAFCDYLLSFNMFLRPIHAVLHLSVLHFFLLLNIIPLYKYTKFCLAIHELMKIWHLFYFILLLRTLFFLFFLY